VNSLFDVFASMLWFFFLFMAIWIFIAIFGDIFRRTDIQAMTRAEAANKAVASVSTADELAKLQQLKDAGTITATEYDALKAKTIAASA
jgi:septation ring formation regulator EzrA